LKKLVLIIALFLFYATTILANDSTTVCLAKRISSEAKIDGNLDEDFWKVIDPAKDFIQRLPNEGKPANFRSEVKIAYTDYAIYIGAHLYDEHPELILKQLGNRDDDGLNADYFMLKFDTYNKRQDAYQFGVYASGVQTDSRISDFTFDAVWQSEVKIVEDGWIVEMEIPYSAIRFPEVENQTWAFQINRTIRRTRELDGWSYVPSNVNNGLTYWGTLQGINNIKTPMRLSLQPYAAATYENVPYLDADGATKYEESVSYSLGADVKYGIDDRFTVDMTLFPDFGQVQSDKTIKNLSYREVVYAENRPFFKEGTELFSKGNLFYSRRIGKTPDGYYDVFNDLKEGEKIKENPAQVKLLNATKISGRTNQGLGLGFLNSVTANTYAEIENANGETRKVLTEPMTNFNILVLDQQLKNNSNFYFINTSTIRTKGYQDANVTGAGTNISNKKNNFNINAEGFISQKYNRPDVASNKIITAPLGYKYILGLSKLGGNLTYGAERTTSNTAYQVTDLGYYEVPGQKQNYIYVRYNQFRPWKRIRESGHNLIYNLNTDYKTNKIGYNELSWSSYVSFLDFNTYFAGAGMKVQRGYDYYEAREEGKVFHDYRYYYAYLGLSSDYRKMLAIDYTFNVSNFIDKLLSEGFKNELSLRFRPSDKLFIVYTLIYNTDPYNLGYANRTNDGTTIFGARRLKTVENQLNVSYIFNKNMSLTVIGRHYWITGAYRQYYDLLENGELIDDEVYAINNDFNFNVFNIDFIYKWRFAPGSDLNFTYKNGIQTETRIVETNYSKNLSNLIESPNTNIFSIKLIYFLDFQHLLKHTTNKG